MQVVRTETRLVWLVVTDRRFSRNGKLPASAVTPQRRSAHGRAALGQTALTPLTQQQQEQRRQIRRTVLFLAGLAACFYFGFIIATALKG